METPPGLSTAVRMPRVGLEQGQLSLPLKLATAIKLFPYQPFLHHPLLHTRHSTLSLSLLPPPPAFPISSLYFPTTSHALPIISPRNGLVETLVKLPLPYVLPNLHDSRTFDV